MHPGTRLRALLARPEIVVLPGVHDPLTARLAALQGFEAIMAGGNAATGTLLAAPDMGQMGMSDYADHYARVVAAAGLPVLVDADTGFGGVHNVTHTIRAFERAGAAGLFMEDQVTPKRCGYIAGKAVVSVAEQVSKLKAALDARTNAEFVICARTDALAVEGMDAAIERVSRYKETGVDMVFVQGADSLQTMRHVVQAVPGWHLANISQAAGSAGLTIAEAEEAGASAVMFSIATMLAAAAAVENLLKTLKRDRSLDAVKAELMPMAHYNEVVGLDRMQAAEDRYTA
jgi:2-methylisocitrate lyase-like PEP mutase family enzyme